MNKLKISNVFINTVLLLAVGITLIFTGCANADSIPPKFIPSYEFSISSPEVDKNGGTIAALPGETVILPLTVHSNANVPIAVGVILPDNPVPLPDFITVLLSKEYKTLRPSENVTVDTAYVINKDAIPGTYQTALACELKNPAPNRGEKPTYSFQIKVN